MRLDINKEGLKGSLTVPSDKSISHRSIMLGAIAHGNTTVKNFLRAEDCMNTIKIFRDLGVKIQDDGEIITIHGKGIEGLKNPKKTLDVGNSGTSIRLISGILAGAPFETIISGDKSIEKRPMNRIMKPLNMMGAICRGKDGGQYPPLRIQGNSHLNPIRYQMPVASAQVKSAILFAGLQAQGETIIEEKEMTRNHTELMIGHFGGKIQVKGKNIYIQGPQKLYGQYLQVPGDMSSAAFFIAAGLIIPRSKIILKNVGLNPSRTGIIDVAKKMGGNITIEKERGSHSGTIIVESSQLKGIEIGGSIIPRLIDELPIIALMASQACGKTIIRDAEELKVKETNRIDAVATELNKLGANIRPTEDGMIIQGNTPLQAGNVTSYGDHRMGMMLQIAALLVKEGNVDLDKAQAISVSYPNFFEDLKSLY